MTKMLSYSLVLVTVAGAGYLTGSWRAPQDTVWAAPASAPRTVLHYRCPMHPHVTSTHSGTTPCCGMQFEPVYSDGIAAAQPTLAPGAIVMSATQQQLIGVEIGTAEEAAGVETVRVFGRVATDETRVYRLTAGLEAYLTELSTVTTGSRVRKDQWLASYSTPEARVPIAAYITAVSVLDREQNNGNPAPAALAAARTSLSLAVDRLLTMGMSRVQIDEIRRSRVGGTTVRITSPVDGIVVARSGSAGQRFDAGTELFQIADLRRVWILADVPVADAPRIGPGKVARVTAGGREIAAPARVSSQGVSQFDSASQSFAFRLELDNPDFVLRPGMFVDVDIQVPYPATLMVPSDAVVGTGLREYVWVERRAGVFEPREVQTGRRHDGQVEVVKGLQPGDRIARSGTFLLDSESRMKGHDHAHH
jgi:Cu(I)/Ag(I) efflux system membrane fusion protein